MLDIRKIRKAARLSQADLAARTGIDRSRLSHAENGHLQLRNEELDQVVKAVLIEAQALAQAAVQAVVEP